MPNPACPTCLQAAADGDRLPDVEALATQRDLFGGEAVRWRCSGCDGEFLVPVGDDHLQGLEGGDPWPTS